MRVVCEGITEEEMFVVKLGKVIEVLDTPDQWYFKGVLVGEPYEEYLKKLIKGS
jgi:hypothetical protein